MRSTYTFHTAGTGGHGLVHHVTADTVEELVSFLEGHLSEQVPPRLRSTLIEALSSATVSAEDDFDSLAHFMRRDESVPIRTKPTVEDESSPIANSCATYSKSWQNAAGPEDR